MSWYKFDEWKLKQNQKHYIQFLEELFNVRKPTGEILPYKMVSWQKEYHSLSLNVLGSKAENIILAKARGISFTWSSMIELIITALRYPSTIIPIIAQREKSSVDMIKIVRWLIENANYEIGAKFKETEVVFNNGSIIRAYPSNNVDAVRGKRLVRVLIDEAAFINNLERLLAAAINTMQQKPSQILMGSTFNGRLNYFYELWENKKLKGWKKLYYPAFDKKKVDIQKPLTQQNLTPLVWWYDLEKLEEERRRDWRWFMQEYMVEVLDDTTSFFPLDLIISCEDENLKEVEKGEEGKVYYMGVDVATKHDWSAIVVVEKVGDVFVERKIWWNDKELDLSYLEKVIDGFIINYNPLYVVVDATGIGMQIAQDLRRKWGSRVVMLNFASREKWEGVSKGVKLYMAERLKQLMTDGKIKLLSNHYQRLHLSSLDFNIKTKNDDKLGHADIAFALMLALYKDVKKTEVVVYDSI